MPASFWKVLLSALSERDETAEICFDAEGRRLTTSVLPVPFGIAATERFRFFRMRVGPRVQTPESTRAG